MKKQLAATIWAVLAAVFYALNMPLSKMLLEDVQPTVMAALLYLGAGAGVGIMFLFGRRRSAAELLSKSDLPYVVGMILLDILAPILLMFGLQNTASASASLLNNFEIAATAIIALFIFKEAISPKLWVAIALVTASGIVLSVEDLSELKFSWGALLVLGAALCWGFENNCTRSISSKNTFQIVMLKGIFSGLGSLIISFVIGESLPGLGYAAAALGLGFVAYGLSIFFYIRAQSVIGAAKTGAYYAIAPFVGAFLSFVLLKEELTARYLIALAIMIVGTAVVVWDTFSGNKAKQDQ